MHRFLLGLALVSSARLFAAADPAMGSYEGFWKTADGGKGRMNAQLRPLGGGKYDGFVAFYRAKNLEAALNLKAGTDKFEGSAAKASNGSLTADLTGAAQLENGKLTGTFKSDFGEGTFEGTLAHPTSPTMGAKPPKNAQVIFDGKQTNAWTDFRWKISPEGAAVAGGGDIHAKDKFANFLLHVEFRTPLMPEARDQGRGNSGVYLQNKYEVQVLDSFGLFPPQNNDCAAIYTVKAPEMNACFAPGEWQTYDITYVQGNAARKELPTVTVIHNGVAVIEKFELPAKVVANGTGGDDKADCFLRLQDHGNAVEYRNIWVQPFFATGRK
jgi:hypothetical protein